jgi:hypothetical protein
MNFAIGILSLVANHWTRGCTRYWKLVPLPISGKGKGYLPILWDASDKVDP